jgi:hypothetical protein
MLQRDGVLRCSLARAANTSARSHGRRFPALHEARCVEHVFGKAIICKVNVFNIATRVGGVPDLQWRCSFWTSGKAGGCRHRM